MSLLDNRGSIIGAPAPPAAHLDLDLFAAAVADARRQVNPSERHRVLDPRVAPPRWGWPPRRRTRVAFTEAFRLLAVSIEQMAVKAPLKTIVVMGAQPREGRTTVAANLALALAASGKRVVMLDADTRAPAMARLFNLDGRQPHSAGEPNGHDPHAPNGRIRSDGPPVWAVPNAPGLALITAASFSSEPLDTALAVPLLAALRSVADFTVIDSPPCAVYSDAFHLAPLTHGVIYVVRRRQQDVEDQGRVRDLLERLGTPILTAVFNDC